MGCTIGTSAALPEQAACHPHLVPLWINFASSVLKSDSVQARREDRLTRLRDLHRGAFEPWACFQSDFVSNSRSDQICENDSPARGYIGLQNHDPGDVVWFKEVAVASTKSR